MKKQECRQPSGARNTNRDIIDSMERTAPIKISDELKIKLRTLADRYEVASFTEADPSQFLKWYRPEEGRGTTADVEVASFIAAMLAF